MVTKKGRARLDWIFVVESEGIEADVAIWHIKWEKEIPCLC